MVSSTLTSPSSLDTATKDLVLRVCGSTRHGQIVRLRSAKCTIGSGPRCTLRLRARGVGPVHCLVLRGTGGTVVRRWSPDTRLNGRAFTDARLMPGDRLSIGSIDLEVLQAGQPPDLIPAEARPSEFPTSPRGGPPDGEISSPGPSDLRRIDELTTRLKLANHQGRQRSRRLLEQLRAAKEEIVRLQQWQAERAEWETKRAEEEERIGQETEHLAKQQAELAAEREDLEHRRESWEAEHAQIEAEQIDPMVDSERSHEPEAQEASDQAPVDISEVFHRMGSGGSLPEEEQEPQPAAAESEPAEGAMAGRASPPPPQTDDEAEDEGEDESIDDYMSRLMERVHATTDDAQPGVYRPQKSRPRRPTKPVTRADESPAPATGVPQPQEAAEILPRAVAPEKRVGLSAMRELANLSAQTAIDRHARRQMVSLRRSKLLMAVFGLVAGGLLMWMWSTRETTDLTFYSALVALLVALFWGIQYAVLTGRMIVNKSGHLDLKSRSDRQSDDGELGGDGEKASIGSGASPALDDQPQAVDPRSAAAQVQHQP